MSGSVLPPSEQSQALVLGPGIAGLFIQGIETGLVFSQFSQWFNARRDHSGCSIVSTIIVFVTIVGLAQSGMCFASAWTKYVQKFGGFLLPDWGDYVHSIPTLFISVPVQALMIQRCYHLSSKNLLIITPLVLLLVASILGSLWTVVLIVKTLTVFKAEAPPPSLQRIDISKSCPYLMSVMLPSFLDIILTGILLHYLTRTMKRVYAAHMRKRLSRFVNIVWQSALPPTLCAICVSVFYIQFSSARQKKSQYWLPVIQAMIGKLYVLSLFHMINAQPLQLDERSIPFMSTLTVPAEAMYTVTRDVQGRDVTCGEISTEFRSARTVDSAV